MTEWWDLYDAQRQPLGIRHQRGVALQADVYHLVVDVWVIYKQTLLLTQRHPNKPKGLLWEVSGGSVLAGETSVQGACRELAEETGIEVQPEALTCFYTEHNKHDFVDSYVLFCDTKPTLVLQPEEVVDACWVTWQRLWTYDVDQQLNPSFARRLSNVQDQLKQMLAKGRL